MKIIPDKKSGRIRLAAAALAAAVLLGMLPQQAHAVETDRTGYIQVAPGSEEFMKDLTGTDLVVDVYKVAEAVPEASADTYSLKAVDTFAKVKDIDKKLDASEFTAEDWAEIAEDCLKQVSDDAGAKPEASEKAAQDGKVTVPVKVGLYLLVPRNASVTDKAKYITVNPDDQDQGMVSVVQTDLYMYHFAAQLIAVPTKEAAADTEESDTVVIRTDNPGEWLYGTADDPVRIVLKPSRVSALTELEIVKTINVAEMEEGYSFKPVTFVFSITGRMPGQSADSKPAYSDVAAIHITDPKKQTESVKVQGLPVGMTVVVEEVYSGASYVPVPGADGLAQSIVLAETENAVRFTNRYNNARTDGHGIVNGFTYEDVKGADGIVRPDWVWRQSTPTGGDQ